LFPQDEVDPDDEVSDPISLQLEAIGEPSCVLEALYGMTIGEASPEDQKLSCFWSSEQSSTGRACFGAA